MEEFNKDIIEMELSKEAQEKLDELMVFLKTKTDNMKKRASEIAKTKKHKKISYNDIIQAMKETIK
jgi:histone H3/H4